MRQGALDGEGFWRFSLAFYARPGVAPALLELQDRHGRDVNVILWALWVGCVGGTRLSRPDLRQAETAAAELGGLIIGPFRALRRRLKSDADPHLRQFRHRIARVELAAERRLQARLAPLVEAKRTVSRAAERLGIAEANLALYLGAEQLSSPAGQTVRRALAAFLRR